MKVALLGLTQSGKKTFFSLLTGRSESAKPGYVDKKLLHLKEGESIEGASPVHDERVDTLSRIFKPEKIRYAENTIVLCPDVEQKTGKRQWLEPARRCDMLCILLRAFTSSAVYHPAGSVDAERDHKTLEAELILADLELIETRVSHLVKEKRAGSEPMQIQEENALLKVKKRLENEMNLVALDLQPHELQFLKGLSLLSLKPMLWAYNVDEDRLGKDKESAPGMFKVSCKIEQEIMALANPEERKAYLADLGVTGSGLDRLNQAAYDALGLMSFYTVRSNEVRAWTIRKGTKAPDAAGKVHSDMERGFIRVEVIKFNDLVAAGSEEAAKAQGKAQIKGKDYVIEDGDICTFRFNV
jgi:GTP-binding protein YchF